MSPDGYILMAEMIANNEINLDLILAEVRRGMAQVCHRCGMLYETEQAALECPCV